MAGRRSCKRPYYGPNNSREPDLIDPEEQEPLNDRKRTPVLDEFYKTESQEFIAFDSRFVRAMLGNVKVLMIGDSLMRGLYKDFITWTKHDHLSTDRDLKGKAESSYKGDRQIDVSLLSDDKVFRQAREKQTETHLIQFLFTTRVMKDDMELLIQQMLGEDGYPDVILINSMIWDLTRYFKVSTEMSYSDKPYQKSIEIECLQKYLDRTSMLLRRLRAILPPHAMVIWVCFPHCRPSRPSANGRGIQNEPLAQERNHFIRSVMIDGSFRISQVVRNAGYDVLDLGFYMRNHAFYHYQNDDGMHWKPAGVRLMSQLVIQFLAKSWGIDVSPYLTRLEEKQGVVPLKMAHAQIKKHAYFTPEVRKLQDAIAKTTFKKLNSNQNHAVKEVVQKGRTLTPFVQPPMRLVRRVSSFGAQRPAAFVEAVRLAPRVNRSMAHDVDSLGIQLRTILGNTFQS